MAEVGKYGIGVADYADWLVEAVTQEIRHDPICFDVPPSHAKGLAKRIIRIVARHQAETGTNPRELAKNLPE